MRFKIISGIITLIIVYLAITQLQWNVILANFLKADLYFIILSLLTWGVLVILKGIKWKNIVAALGGTISILDSARLLFIGLFVSIITPGRLGDFVRAIFLKKQMAMGKGILAVAVDRIFDVIILLLFAGIGITILLENKGIEIISIPVFALVVITAILGISLSLNRRFAKKIIWPIIKKIAPTNIISHFENHGKTFYDGIPIILSKKNRMITIAIISIASWATSVTIGWFILQALDINIGWTAALTIIPILALIEIIPIGVLGIGTRELAAVIVMTPYGVSPELAVGFSLVHFAIGYIPSFIMGGIFFNQESQNTGELKKWFNEIRNDTKS